LTKQRPQRSRKRVLRPHHFRERGRPGSLHTLRIVRTGFVPPAIPLARSQP